MPAPGRLQAPEVPLQELAQVLHHEREIAVVLVMGGLGQHVGPGHRDLDLVAGIAPDHQVLIHQTEVGGVADPVATDRGRVEHARVLVGDRLGPGRAPEGRDPAPEEVEHGVGRRVPVARPSVHLAAGDDVDAGDLLIEQRRLGGAVVRIAQVGRAQHAAFDQLLERFVPARHAVRAHDRGDVSLIPRHGSSPRPDRPFDLTVTLTLDR